MELTGYNGVVPEEASTLGALSMTPLETMLTDALLANAKLREEGERLIAAYIEPKPDRQAIINDLIRLFDSPEQRKARQLAAEALEQAGEEGAA